MGRDPTKGKRGVRAVPLPARSRTIRAAAPRAAEQRGPPLKRSRRPTKSFSRGDENVLKQSPIIEGPDQTAGFDHVGLHHQPDLRPVAQQFPGRRSEAGSKAMIEAIAVLLGLFSASIFMAHTIDAFRAS
jgi:hypothetical protein